jgi:hypothetical protein
LVNLCWLQNNICIYLHVDYVFAEAEQRYMIDADWHVRDCLAGFEKCAKRKLNLLFEINRALAVDKGSMPGAHLAVNSG